MAPPTEHRGTPTPVEGRRYGRPGTPSTGLRAPRAFRPRVGQAGSGTPPGSPPGSSGVASIGGGGSGSGASGSSSPASSGTGSSGSICGSGSGIGSTMRRVNQGRTPETRPARGSAGGGLGGRLRRGICSPAVAGHEQDGEQH